MSLDEGEALANYVSKATKNEDNSAALGRLGTITPTEMEARSIYKLNPARTALSSMTVSCKHA